MLHRRAGLVQRFLRGFLQEKLSGDRHHAVLHLGVDIFQAPNTRNGVFNLACDFSFKLRRRAAGQAGCDDDVGHIQIGKVLHLHVLVTQHACKAEHDKKHDGGNRVFDAPSRDVHKCGFLFAANLITGSTCIFLGLVGGLRGRHHDLDRVAIG